MTKSSLVPARFLVCVKPSRMFSLLPVLVVILQHHALLTLFSTSETASTSVELENPQYLTSTGNNTAFQPFSLQSAIQALPLVRIFAVSFHDIVSSMVTIVSACLDVWWVISMMSKKIRYLSRSILRFQFPLPCLTLMVCTSYFLVSHLPWCNGCYLSSYCYSSFMVLPSPSRPPAFKNFPCLHLYYLCVSATHWKPG